LRKFAEKSAFAKELKRDAEQQGKTFDWRPLVARVHLLGVEVELTNLRGVYEVSRKIMGHGGGIGSPDGLQNVQIPRLDALIMNAGIGGWMGLNWPLAVWDVLTKMPDSVTWPEFKIARIGATVKQQLGIGSNGDGEGQVTQRLLDGTGNARDETAKGEPALGEIFCANVFGHYLLGHELMPMLSSSEGRAKGDKGRIIWVSSIEAQDQVIDEDDFQHLTSNHPYENTKRLTDVLAITSDLPSVQKASGQWFEISSAEKKTLQRPEIYVTHPGICATSIIEIAVVLQWAFKCVLYIARLVGGIWHPIASYKGAVAPVWVALAEQSTLDSMEAGGSQKAKWGSSTDCWGNERVRRTEVGGWGWRGVVGETDADLMKGRKREARELTLEQREEFEALGARCWRKMEELRREWEERLGI
jgi:3-keto steroid reductase